MEWKNNDALLSKFQITVAAMAALYVNFNKYESADAAEEATSGSLSQSFWMDCHIRLKLYILIKHWDKSRLPSYKRYELLLFCAMSYYYKSQDGWLGESNDKLKLVQLKWVIV